MCKKIFVSNLLGHIKQIKLSFCFFIINEHEKIIILDPCTNTLKSCCNTEALKTLLLSFVF